MFLNISVKNKFSNILNRIQCARDKKGTLHKYATIGGFSRQRESYLPWHCQIALIYQAGKNGDLNTKFE